MKRLLFIFSAFFVLSGCAARDAQISPMLNGMGNVNKAIHSFGPPVQVSDMHDGAKIYVWTTERSAQVGGLPVYQPNNQTHTGAVYSPSGGYVGSYSGQSQGTGAVTYTPVQNLNFFCTLKMIVEPSGHIRTWTYQGNACDSLIVNASLPPTAQRLSVHDCLAQSANEYASEGLELEAFSAKIEQECERMTGEKVPNLAKYYVRQAQEGR